MEFIADLHLHSRFSRATAKNLDLENIYRASCLKGVKLVGTGDFTHPEWVAEIEDKLEPAEDGLYKLKPLLADKIDKDIPKRCRTEVRFILQCEISSIYKKEGRVRKNHNLIYFPDIDTVKMFNRRLDEIGNITSDGRPILGLDAFNLLEIMLEISEDGFLIPAHIWTPWFSMLGSKSGFDSIEECFGSLSHHIFAVETGLSSDPPMNWRVPCLDNVRLISNSDAHSPMYIGRNASCFNTDLSFFNIRDALKSGSMDTYCGTIDMFPEEGKYHYDGHRKCNVCLNPSETGDVNGLCPECGKPLTLGVLYRVHELAKRPEDYIPENRHGYKSIIPLADILSEIFEVGPKTKKVSKAYHKALDILGPELDILLYIDIKDIEGSGIPLLSEAVSRMRKKKVHVYPGFDGEYGKIKVFDSEEKKLLKGERSMFVLPGTKKGKKSEKTFSRAAGNEKKNTDSADKKSFFTQIGENSSLQKFQPVAEEKSVYDVLESLNAEQKKAVYADDRPILIEAGPGTGKTRTLTARIAALILEKNVSPSSILALTFTNQAATEIKDRIHILLSKKAVPGSNQPVPAHTFHGFCLNLLKEYDDFTSSIVDDGVRLEMIRYSMLLELEDGRISDKIMERLISKAKQRCLTPDDLLDGVLDEVLETAESRKSLSAGIFSKVWRRYQELLLDQNLVDFEDIIQMTLNLFSDNMEIKKRLKDRFSHILVDEYQDINKGQYLLIRHLSGDGRKLFVIGDPDQSIYGFRGSDNSYFKCFSDDYPGTEKIVLKNNYRSSETILEASFQLISADEHKRERIYSSIISHHNLLMLEASSEKAEAVAVGKTIERLVGGTSMFSMDAGKADAGIIDQFSFSDFAVLYRTGRQSDIFADVFKSAGIPFQRADREDIFMQKGIRELISFLRIALLRGTVFDFETVLNHMNTATGKVARRHLKDWFFSLNMPFSDALPLLIDSSIPGIRKDISKKISSAGTDLTALIKKLKKLETRELLKAAACETDLIRVINENIKSKDIFENLLKDAGHFPYPGDFLDHLSMKKDTECIDMGIEKVSLMTMHAAKGLEFPVVFVAGCEAGLIPLCFDGKVCKNLNEERRLFYVAMTRAKDILCLSHSKKRRIFGKTLKTMKSPFLYDIEEGLKSYSKNDYKKEHKKKCGEQLELFSQ